MFEKNDSWAWEIACKCSKISRIFKKFLWALSVIYIILRNNFTLRLLIAILPNFRWWFFYFFQSSETETFKSLKFKCYHLRQPTVIKWKVKLFAGKLYIWTKFDTWYSAHFQKNLFILEMFFFSLRFVQHCCRICWHLL